MTTVPKKVLIIDDDPTTVKMLASWLTSSGRQVIAANDGIEGYKKAKDGLPDLIILDLMLPRQTGTKTAIKLQKDFLTKDIPIIFITALLGVENDKGDEEIIIESQSYRVFAKPLHRMKLLSEVRKAINRRVHHNL